VARRQDKHSPDEETVFINLLRKPNTALEAIVLADERGIMVAQCLGAWLRRDWG